MLHGDTPCYKDRIGTVHVADMITENVAVVASATHLRDGSLPCHRPRDIMAACPQHRLDACLGALAPRRSCS